LPVDDGRVQFAVGVAPDSADGTGTYTDQLTFIVSEFLINWLYGARYFNPISFLLIWLLFLLKHLSKYLKSPCCLFFPYKVHEYYFWVFYKVRLIGFDISFKFH
jgi:hypothetical protein